MKPLGHTVESCQSPVSLVIERNDVEQHKKRGGRRQMPEAHSGRCISLHFVMHCLHSHLHRIANLQCFAFASKLHCQFTMLPLPVRTFSLSLASSRAESASLEFSVFFISSGRSSLQYDVLAVQVMYPFFYIFFNFQCFSHD